jgi:hypothetical protein
VTSALFQCDGATIPAAFESAAWEIRDCVNCQGPAATLNLRLENLSHALLATIHARATDLVRIAAYAYADDQSVSRGGPADVYAKRWRRHFGMAVPVRDPGFWNQTASARSSRPRWSFCPMMCGSSRSAKQCRMQNSSYLALATSSY